MEQHHHGAPRTPHGHAFYVFFVCTFIIFFDFVCTLYYVTPRERLRVAIWASARGNPHQPHDHVCDDSLYRYTRFPSMSHKCGTPHARRTAAPRIHFCSMTAACSQTWPPITRTTSMGNARDSMRACACHFAHAEQRLVRLRFDLLAYLKRYETTTASVWSSRPAQ